MQGSVVGLLLEYRHIIVSLLGSFGFMYWYRTACIGKVPELWYNRKTKVGQMVSKLPVMNREFHPTWWCPFGFTQTVMRQLLRSKPSLPWRREVVTFPDGGCTAVDWLESEGLSETSPIVVFLPGITGSTHDCSYIIHCAIEAEKMGWRSVVVNARGLGGVPLKTARTYTAAHTDDIECVIKQIVEKFPNAPKMACGFSMGGMITWNYLAKHSAENCGLKGALLVSSPFDTFKSTASLEAFVPKLFFNGHLAECLKNIVKPYKHLFKDKLDWDKLMKVDTIKGFDANFVVPMFGYNHVDEYYHEATLRTKVHKIPIPTLALNSRDDCFAPLDQDLLDDVASSQNVVHAITEHGGHTAFMKHTNPSAVGLVEEVLIDYGKLIFNEL